ncbi:unnamed protein product [Sphagnum balticum]
MLGSVTSSYHLTYKGTKGKGTRSLCGLGLTNVAKWPKRCLKKAAFGREKRREVGNDFVVLPSGAFDPEEEWGRFVTTVSVVAAKTVRTQGPEWRNRLGLSLGTLELIAAKRAAHLDFIDEVREQLDTAFKNIEGVLSAQGDDTRVAEELTLAKVWVKHRWLGSRPWWCPSTRANVCGNPQIQRINLLNILGKVYAMLFMHRMSLVVWANLHEAQCNFRFGRGTVDTMFVMCQLSSVAQRKWFAMRINAIKTKVMLVGKGDSRLLATVTISGGQGSGARRLYPVLAFVGELAPRGHGEGAGLQHLCITALCLWGQDLECDAISIAPIGGSIQQLLERDHGRPGVKSAQLVVHLEHLQGQAVGLHAYSA